MYLFIECIYEIKEGMSVCVNVFYFLCLTTLSIHRKRNRSAICCQNHWSERFLGWRCVRGHQEGDWGSADGGWSPLHQWVPLLIRSLVIQLWSFLYGAGGSQEYNKIEAVPEFTSEGWEFADTVQLLHRYVFKWHRVQGWAKAGSSLIFSHHPRYYSYRENSYSGKWSLGLKLKFGQNKIRSSSFTVDLFYIQIF